MSAFPQKAEISRTSRQVRNVPKADLRQAGAVKFKRRENTRESFGSYGSSSAIRRIANLCAWP